MTSVPALRVAGVCVKVVGVQSGLLSHSLQHSAGLCRSDPLRAHVEVKVFHGWNEWLRRYFSFSEMRQSLGATKIRNQNFEVCSVYTDKHCAAVSQKKQRIHASVALYSQCVRTLIHNKQLN